jgi:hypothetical protein
LNKINELNGNSSRRRNNKSINEQAIKDSVKWSITEYYVFVRKLVKKGLSLYTDEKLEKGCWFSGIYVNNQGVMNFTDPFTMEKKPINNNNNIIGAVGSFDLSDSSEYYVIPETSNKFVEILDNKGEIDPDFPLKDYTQRLSHPSSPNSKNAVKVSIRNMMMLYQILLKMRFKKVHF